LKYHRVTAAGETKDYYRPEEAATRAAEHAAHFLAARARQAAWLAPAMDRPPVTVAPYDAELFGHWWHEGPAFLEAVFRGMQAATPGLEPVTLPEVLRRHPVNQMVLPSSSSWGAGGYNFVWLSGSNAWLYRHLHLAASDMVRLARRHRDPDEPTRRALNQAARELVLLQSSDWAFIMRTGTTVPYATKRVCDHLNRFNALYEGILKGALNEKFLKDLESKDNLFADLDYRVYLK
jgi:1,4-alpha-glucan branching enzyme